METGLEKKLATLTEAQKLMVSGYVDFLLVEEAKKKLINEPETIYQSSDKRNKLIKAGQDDAENAINGAEKPTEGKKLKREFGSLKGFITYIADDFDAPLEDFKDYMWGWIF